MSFVVAVPDMVAEAAAGAAGIGWQITAATTAAVFSAGSAGSLTGGTGNRAS